MITREFKFNLKSFLILNLITLGLLLVVFLVYPSITNNENVQMMDEMVNMFPEELLKTFNMDIAMVDTVFGWLKSEGFVFLLLIIGCYCAILGSGILLKEESEKTIEYLNSLPITRTRIVLEKTFVGISYITLMIVILGVFNYVGLELSGDFDRKQYILLSITPIFPAFVIFFLCLFLSTFTHKSKKMLGISLGIVLISYVLQAISTMSDKVEFLKYFSAFTLADIRGVIMEIRIQPVMIIVTLCVSAVLFLATVIRYNKKELV